MDIFLTPLTTLIPAKILDQGVLSCKTQLNMLICSRLRCGSAKVTRDVN